MATAVVVDPLLQAQELASRLVEAAQKAGAAVCDATVGTSSALTAKARDGEVEDVSRSTSRAAAIRVVVDGRMGFATSADAPHTAAEVAALAETAVALARLSSPSPYNVMPDVGAVDAAVLNARAALAETWDDETAQLSADWAVGEALLMERALREAPGIDGVKDVSASARRGVFALSTSGGFVGAWRGTSCSLSCAGVLQDGPRLQTEGDYTQARARRRLWPAADVAARAAARVRARKGAKKLSSMRVPVIFEPETARGLLGSLAAAACGDAIARRQSFLVGKKGQQIFAKGTTLLDEPTLVGGFASRPFDGEGLTTPVTRLFDEDGVLLGYFHDGKSAARTGERPTGHASRGAVSLPQPSPTNLSLLGGKGDLQSIIQETKRGVVVTQLLGRGPDMVSGDYSRGAAGFYVEDGAIVHAVEEITIAGNFLEMLLSIDRVGADLDLRSSLRAPTLRVAEMQVSGK